MSNEFCGFSKLLNLRKENKMWQKSWSLVLKMLASPLHLPQRFTTDQQEMGKCLCTSQLNCTAAWNTFHIITLQSLIVECLSMFFKKSFYRPGFSLSLSPDRSAATKITTSVLDISGLASLQESPKRVTAARCHAQKRPPAIGDYITVTDSMGNRVYLNKKEDEEKVSDPTSNFT